MSNDNNNNDDKYGFLKQFSKDIERSNNTTAPYVPLSTDAPTCRKCSIPFHHDWDTKHYICPSCCRVIHDSEIQYDPQNINVKYPGQISAQKQQELLEQQELEERRRVLALEQEQQLKQWEVQIIAARLAPIKFILGYK
jgi:hypothetical protein